VYKFVKNLHSELHITELKEKKKNYMASPLYFATELHKMYG